MMPWYWIGDVLSTSSYAQCARRILPLLTESGWAIRPIVSDLPPGTAQITDRTWRDWVAFYKLSSGSTLSIPGHVIYNALPATISPTSSPGWVYSGWDARPYPFSWVDALKGQHGFVTWSDWSAQVAQASGIPSVAVIPLGWDPFNPPPALPPQKSGGIIHIGALGQMVPRKRMVETVLGWWQTFTDQDPVELWIKVSPSVQIPTLRFLMELHHQASKFPHRPPTHIWAGEWTAQQLAQWYARLDIFTSLSAGEGFGLPMLEAAAWGATVVLPEGAGGWQDWLPTEIPQVPTTWQPIPAGGIPDWQEPGMEWTVPDQTVWQQRLWFLVHHEDHLRREQQCLAPAAYRYGHPDRIRGAWHQWRDHVIPA